MVIDLDRPILGPMDAAGTADYVFGPLLDRYSTVTRPLLDRYDRYTTVGALCATIVPLCFYVLCAFLPSLPG